jgi:hypothetical protein
MSESVKFGRFRTVNYVRNVRETYGLGHSDMTSDIFTVMGWYEIQGWIKA